MTRTLHARGLGVTLGGQRVLDEVDLAISPGEWLGVIGPNGGGKSTLLRAVAGLVNHDGTVTLGDGGTRPGAADIAYMPQTPTLPQGMSVVEYVLVGRTAHLSWLQRESRQDREVAVAVLRRLELARFAERPVGSLSGGEAQRVVIARALAQQAPVLLLDEPTSALDMGHQTDVLDLVDDLRRIDGLTIVAAMHDLSVAAHYADRLALLDHGRLVAVGAPVEVLEPSRISAVYRTSLAIHELDGRLLVVPAARPLRSAPNVSATGRPESDEC